MVKGIVAEMYLEDVDVSGGTAVVAAAGTSHASRAA